MTVQTDLEAYGPAYSTAEKAIIDVFENDSAVILEPGTIYDRSSFPPVLHVAATVGGQQYEVCFHPGDLSSVFGVNKETVRYEDELPSRGYWVTHPADMDAEDARELPETYWEQAFKIETDLQRHGLPRSYNIDTADFWCDRPTLSDF